MSFVHVKHVWLDPERGESFHAADTQHDFLTHAHLEVAAIKLRGDQSVLRAVLRNVAVEEIDVHPADSQFPHPGEDFAIQNRYRNQKFRFASANFADRQVIKILVEINRRLNAVFIDLLPEIAVSIKQTHRNEIEIKVARGFAVVASEDSQAAGVIWD